MSLPARDSADRAQVLARKARDDATAVREFAGNPDISDAIIGFHAQQAVEKWLKALIADQGLDYKSVHDIDYLIEVFQGAGGELPVGPDRLTALTIYAVPLRYDELLDTEPLDRDAAVELIEKSALGKRKIRLNRRS